MYRIFNDADELLYVGMTVDPGQRIGDHRGLKRWWQQVARITLTWFDDRPTAAAAELAAIRDERPLYNVREPAADGRVRTRREIPSIALRAANDWYDHIGGVRLDA